MQVIHLDAREFITASHHRYDITARPYVLDNGIAGMVYMFEGEGSRVYYLDHMFTPRKEDLKRMDPEDLHAELYRKVALDVRLKN
ncbi:hypothetical protein [Catenisphaera adipataccumulans]|jgi:hypothetical protein|uniref:Uncharacterized protein n=1 Tax=Catenisphaera adipataccumulans TaxID=700500 RepID=A0A7W8CXG7_9FIRM|nr:hypothetical protein [Catenisphaera adipataccumulans]MBB5183403.1 hypothetical protein [Catenisphaera adipataccumulans]